MSLIYDGNMTIQESLDIFRPFITNPSTGEMDREWVRRIVEAQVEKQTAIEEVEAIFNVNIRRDNR